LKEFFTMKYSQIATRSVLACAIACSIAAPSFAQSNVGPTPVVGKAVADANAAAERAATAAKAAAEKHAAAQKAADDMRKGVNLPKPPPGLGANFNPSTVKAYADDLNQMLMDMKSVTTPQHASAYADKFKASFANIEANQKRVASALTDAIASGKRTPEMIQAETMLNEAGAKGMAVEAEMVRIEKLHAGTKVPFQKFRDLHN
jgi:hypothetical protein